MGCIYKFINKNNGRIYIGQTINSFTQRKNAHFSSAYNPNASDYNCTFHRAIRKHGKEAFEYEILAKEIHDKELLNTLEKYYIQEFNSFKKGYNETSGGESGFKKREWTQEAKIKQIFHQSELTYNEIVSLRKAYYEKESPSKIYNDLYKDRLEYSSFMNIWTGRRYGNIKPELLEKGRHTKLTKDIVAQIRQDREQFNLSYQVLADKYDISKATIADIIKKRTWKTT